MDVYYSREATATVERILQSAMQLRDTTYDRLKTECKECEYDLRQLRRLPLDEILEQVDDVEVKELFERLDSQKAEVDKLKKAKMAAAAQDKERESAKMARKRPLSPPLETEWKTPTKSGMDKEVIEVDQEAGNEDVTECVGETFNMNDDDDDDDLSTPFSQVPIMLQI